MDNVKLMYLILLAIALTGVAWTYWSDWKRRHQHHRS